MTSPYTPFTATATSAVSKAMAAGTALDIDLTDFSPLDDSQTGLRFRNWSPVREKYVGATWVAKSLVICFAATIFIVIAAGIGVVAVSPSAEIADRFAKTIAGVLDSLTSFATAVFVPLLAFVLGFYFSEKKQG